MEKEPRGLMSSSSSSSSSDGNDPDDNVVIRFRNKQVAYNEEVRIVIMKILQGMEHQTTTNDAVRESLADLDARLRKLEEGRT